MSNRNVSCKLKRLIALVITGVFISGFGDQVFAQKQFVPEAQMVMFTPSDVEPPPVEEYQERLQQYAEYAEQFFDSGLRHWGYEPERKEIFNRDADGKISVIHLQGDLPAKDNAFRKEWISKQAFAKLRTEHQIKPYGHLYWIFVYVGDPPKKSGTFRGAGNANDGGWGVANYANLRGKITPAGDLVSSGHDKFLLKGCLHEFGHGMGLPHIGPKIELKKGNTLMGPITKIYVKNKMPRKTKGYLSEGSAAVLSVHPVFSSEPKPRHLVPETTFEDPSVDYDPKQKTIVVTGKLKETTLKPHRIVVLDDRDDKIGEYWTKSFVSKLDDESRFSVEVPQPNRTGKMRIVAVYENGCVTGGGKKRGFPSALEIPYSFK